MATFDFPPPPPGHYYQIKRGMLNYFKTTAGQEWRVVLMRKVWGIFPVEVSGATFYTLSQENVFKAADRAREGYFTRRRQAELNEVRKDTNFVQRTRRNK